jgi:hypothetical protein
MSLPEDISFNLAYISWLNNPSFNDKIWLTYQHETLDKIAKYFNIKEDDVQDLWKSLKTNPQFYSLFIDELNKISKPYDKHIFNVISKETYSPDCKYPKDQVEKWIEEKAKEFFNEDWINQTYNNFDFNTLLFSSFFKQYRDCSDIIKSVRERKVAKINKKFLTDIVMYVGDYIPNDVKKEELKNRIIGAASRMNLDDKDNIIDKSRDILYQKLRIDEIGSSLNAEITKRMNDKYGDDAPITILAQEYNLPINDSNVSVELYRDLLLKIGIDFINKYVSMMDAVKEVVVVRKVKGKGKKLPAEYKVIVDLENKLSELKERNSELSNKNLSIQRSIANKEKEIEFARDSESKGNRAPEVIQEELDELNKEFDINNNSLLESELEIDSVEQEYKEKQDKYLSKRGGKKEVAPKKKGVFRKSKEEEKEELNPVQRRIQIETTLKYNLFNAISERLPENFNLYNVAEILGLNEKGSIYANNKTLTSKMIKQGSKKLNIEGIELEEEAGELEEENLETVFDGEAEGVDRENLEEYVEDDDANEGESLDGDDYGEAGEDEYSY